MATIVIHTQGTVVEARSQHLDILTPDGARRELPLTSVDRVHCYGKVQVTTRAVHLLAEQGRDLVWFSRRGRLRARLSLNPAFGIELRRAQYRLADNPARALVAARKILEAKLHNQRAVLVRLWRERPELRDEALLERFDELLLGLGKAEAPASLLGLEGTAARLYFTAWAAPMVATFPWNGRNRRPPRDPLNVLLSFLYTLLTNEAHAQIEALGLDPWLGVLHGIRPGRPALALDLIEPLRPLIVDRLIIDLVVHRRIRPEHFTYDTPLPPRVGAPTDEDDEAPPPGEATDGSPLPRLTSEGFRALLTAYEKRMQHRDGEAEHPGGMRQLLHDQVVACATALREDRMDDWQPVRLRT